MKYSLFLQPSRVFNLLTHTHTLWSKVLSHSARPKCKATLVFTLKTPAALSLKHVTFFKCMFHQYVWGVIPDVVMDTASLLLLKSPEHGSPAVTLVCLRGGHTDRPCRRYTQIWWCGSVPQCTNIRIKICIISQESINASGAHLQTQQFTLSLNAVGCFLPDLNFSSLIHVFNTENI